MARSACLLWSTYLFGRKQMFPLDITQFAKVPAILILLALCKHLCRFEMTSNLILLSALLSSKKIDIWTVKLGVIWLRQFFTLIDGLKTCNNCVGWVMLSISCHICVTPWHVLCNNIFKAKTLLLKLMQFFQEEMWPFCILHLKLPNALTAACEKGGNTCQWMGSPRYKLSYSNLVRYAKFLFNLRQVRRTFTWFMITFN